MPHDPYLADPGRYDGRMPYARTGRSGLHLPTISLGLWNNFGDDRPLAAAGRSSCRAFDLGITHFDLANNYGPPDGRRSAPSAASCRGPAAVPRRAGHLDQGRLRHVGRALRRVGLAQVPAREPRPSPGADGPGLRRHLLLAPLRSRHAARGDAGRARHRGAVRARRSTRASPPTRRAHRTRPRASCASSASRCSSTSPRYSMLNRWIEEDLLDVARARGRRLHRLLAARARACSPTSTSTASPRARAPPRAGSSTRA